MHSPHSPTTILLQIKILEHDFLYEKRVSWKVSRTMSRDGFEPSTRGASIHCSTPELSRQLNHTSYLQHMKTQLFLRDRHILAQVLGFLTQIQRKNGHILFVGIGEEHRILLQEYILPRGHSYMTCKWLPGLVTNSIQHEFSHQMYHNLAQMIRKDPTVLRGRASVLFEKMGEKYANILKIIPDVVIFLGYEENFSVGLRECAKMEIPTISFSHSGDETFPTNYPLCIQPSLLNVQQFIKLTCFALDRA